MIENVPCRNCKDRTVTCHSNCEKYNSWKKEKDEFNKKERIRKQIEYITEYDYHTARKGRRKK